MPERDPYVYPGTNVLRNRFDITDRARLDARETSIVMVNFAALLKDGVPGTLSSAWYRKIHRELFGLIYPWAGKFRTMNIAKEGEIRYASSVFLDEQADGIFSGLNAIEERAERSQDEFIAFLSTVMGDLHVLHPFRDGNTRTLQVGAAEIAARHGHVLAWKQADPRTIRLAGTDAAVGDLTPYRDILKTICTPAVTSRNMSPAAHRRAVAPDPTEEREKSRSRRRR